MDPKRHLAAILFADIAGYTAMMQKDEQLAIDTVSRFQEVLECCVRDHHGEVFQYYGDGSLCFFQSAGDALMCAMSLQRQAQQDPVVPLRTGVHIGEILLDGERVFGDGVNIASRIESIGKPGAVLFSSNVFEKIRNRAEFIPVSIGKFEFKNVDEPMEIFALANEGLLVPDRKTVSGKLKKKSVKGTGIAANLRWVGLAGIILFLLGFFLWTRGLLPLGQGREAAQANLKDKSIAVLPFDYNSEEGINYLADGIADEIRSQLLGLRNLKVISRSSSNYYRDKPMTARKIGQELGVGYLLEGSVQSMGGHIKVAVQLVNTKTDKIELDIPSRTRVIEDIFQLENEIAREIVSELQLELTEKESRDLDQVPTENSEAYSKFRRAEIMLHMSGGSIPELDSVVQLFRTAISLDPNFTRAYVGLSDAYLKYIYWGRYPPSEMIAKAREATLQAFQLDNENGACFGTLGTINYYSLDLFSAEKNLMKAIELNPNYLEAYITLSRIRSYQGRLEEAFDMNRIAHSLDPKSTAILASKAQIYYYAKEYEDGIDYIDSVRSVYPEDNFIAWTHGYILTGTKQYAEAIDIFLSRTAGSKTNWMLGYAYGMSGQEAKAREILEYQLAKRQNAHVPAYMIAVVYMGLSEREKAIEWLERDYREGGQGLFFWGLKTDEKFDPIRNDPRFQALLDKFG